MQTNSLFILLLAFFTFVSSQKAFDKVQGLLINFEKDIRDEQAKSDIRYEGDAKKCRDTIAAAEKKVVDRQKDVTDLEEHIKWLENEKSETEKDKKIRGERIEANVELMKKFKDQRCENNLVFIKQLREHMEAIDLLALLKKDMTEYFQKKTGVTPNPAFIERFAEFAHLLSDDKKMIFTELASSIKDLPSVEDLSKKVDANTAQKQRTDQEVGTQHIDNSQGELKPLEQVTYEKAQEYNKKLEAKIMVMIDNLIEHLRNSRRELEKQEIKAAEDFAIFQTNMEKENEYLKTKIVELSKHIEDLSNQVNIGKGQLEKRKTLLDEAQRELNELKKMCLEKEEYYKRETERRTNELQTLKNAQVIFQNILEKLSQRVKERAANLQAGEQAGNELSKEVVKGEATHKTDVAGRVETRAQVAF